MSIPTNVINPKSLEKQLKLVDSRVQELQAELRELEKVRTACLILLGNPAEFAEGAEAKPVEAAAPKSPRKKTEKKDEQPPEVPVTAEAEAAFDADTDSGPTH